MRRPLSFILFLSWAACPVLSADAPEADPQAVIAAAQDAAVKRWFPRCQAKLAKRAESLRVVVLGDRVANFVQPGPAERSDIEQAWHWRFLEHLASRYYFTGGVRSTDAEKSKLKPLAAAEAPRTHDDSEDGPEPAEPLNFDTSGAAIVVDVQARNSAPASEAITALTTDALDRDPDLVILNYGLSDFSQGVSPLSYGRSLTEAIRLCQAKQVDVLVAGPPLALGENERKWLGLTRGMASVAEETAAKAKVYFVDLGALQVMMAVDPKAPRSTQGYDLVLQELKRQYLHSAVRDLVTANADAHRIMADAAWDQLGNPFPEVVSVEAALVLPAEPKAAAQLNLQFHSSGGVQEGLQEIAIGAFSVDNIWVPKDSLTEEETKAEMHTFTASSNVVEGWKVSIPCTAIYPPGPYVMNRPDLPAGEESVARGSLLISEGTITRLINYRAVIQPLAVAFPLGRMENLNGVIPITATVTNNSTESFTGQVEVVWRGKTDAFPVNFAAGQSVPLALKLAIPTEGSAPLKHQLTLRFKQGNRQYDYSREIEISPDLLPDKRVTLENRSTAVADTTPPASDGPSVGLLCKTDDSGLYLIFDLPTVDVNRKRTQPSAKIEVTLDARDTKNCGQLGFCEHVTLNVPWTDGRIPVEKIPFGVFGPGYDRVMEERWFLASVTTQRDNRRQVRLSIPRAYFYKHGWDLKGSGQNALGFNAQVQLLQFPDDNSPGVFLLAQTFSLVSPGLPRNDAQALGVLRLGNKVAQWSARIY